MYGAQRRDLPSTSLFGQFQGMKVCVCFSLRVLTCWLNQDLGVKGRIFLDPVERLGLFLKVRMCRRHLLFSHASRRSPVRSYYKVPQARAPKPKSLSCIRWSSRCSELAQNSGALHCGSASSSIVDLPAAQDRTANPCVLNLKNTNFVSPNPKPDNPRP